MSDLTSDGFVELTESELSDVQGGIGLLLPAVQKVREAAARMSSVAVTDDIVVAPGG